MQRVQKPSGLRPCLDRKQMREQKIPSLPLVRKLYFSQKQAQSGPYNINSAQFILEAYDLTHPKRKFWPLEGHFYISLKFPAKMTIEQSKGNAHNMVKLNYCYQGFSCNGRTITSCRISCQNTSFYEIGFQERFKSQAKYKTFGGFLRI